MSEVEKNVYELAVGGNDTIGYNFIQNIVAMANKGATIKEGAPVIMRFPHSLMMVIETEDEMESGACITVFPIKEPVKEAKAAKEQAKLEAIEKAKKEKEEALNKDKQKAKEHLESLSWEDFKTFVGKKGVSGRDRALMTTKYLALIE